MLVRLIYAIVVCTLFIVCAPWIIYRRWKKGQSLKVLWQRLGAGVSALPKDGRPLIWIHAVSVGETKAMRPLAEELLKLPFRPRLVISSITETGHNEAKKLLPNAHAHIFLPLDISWCVRRVLKKIQPDLVILTEGDYWLNFLYQAKKQGAELVVINGKLSKTSQKRYAQPPGFKETLFSLFSLFCVQNQMYQTRFLDLGIPLDKLKVTGNIKFEAPAKPLTSVEKQALCERFGVSLEHPIVVVGSTHATEEKLIVALSRQVWQQFPTCQFLVAPRHPERSDAIAAEIKALGCTCACYSQLAQTKVQGPHIVLMDRIGLLRDLYALADLAIVGGSFVKHVGGHNILEPALYGTPVLFGPHMWSQEELVHYVLTAKNGEQVTEETLSERVLALLHDASARERMGKAGRELLEAQVGATKRTLDAVMAFL